MRSRVALLTTLATLFLASGQVIGGQQPSGTVSGEKPDGAKCLRPVVVQGEVQVPARFELRRGARLLEVIAMSGGLTERAWRTVVITHAAPSSGCDEPATADEKGWAERTEVYDLDDVRGGKANPVLRPGDVVTVWSKPLIYVTGGVSKPQAITLEGPTTITQAIAAAGGVLPNGLADRVRVWRRSVGIEPTRIVVDLKAIKKKRAEDLVLQPYDIVDVPCKSCPRGGDYFGPRTKTELPLRVIQ
jgi:protein involved in polysaccharide export with SLBB domain